MDKETEEEEEEEEERNNDVHDDHGGFGSDEMVTCDKSTCFGNKYSINWLMVSDGKMLSFSHQRVALYVSNNQSASILPPPPLLH